MIKIKVLMISPKSKTLINFRGDLIKEMILRGHSVVTIGPETGYEDQINKLGARFILLEMEKNSVGIMHDLKYMKRLKKLMDKEKPDVVFSYTIKPIIYGNIAARLSHVRYIYPMFTGLGYVFTTQNLKAQVIRGIVSMLYKISLPSSTKVFFQNSDDLNQFIEEGYLQRDKCILVNGSGVNMNKFIKTPMPKNISFLMIARVMANKGVKEYLEASRIVKRKYPEVKIVLLGAIENIQDSLSFEEVKPYIDDGSIIYYKETNDVRPFIKDCSTFVLPSYREGTPRTVLESMAMGRSIITTDAPGCRETVIDGVNGFLVPVGDINILAERMIWMIEHKEEVEKMGEESLRICKEKYDVKKINKVMLEAMGL